MPQTYRIEPPLGWLPSHVKEGQAPPEALARQTHFNSETIRAAARDVPRADGPRRVRITVQSPCVVNLDEGWRQALLDALMSARLILSDTEKWCRLQLETVQA